MHASRIEDLKLICHLGALYGVDVRDCEVVFLVLVEDLMPSIKDLYWLLFLVSLLH